MILRRISYVVLAIALPAGLWVTYGARAAEAPAEKAGAGQPVAAPTKLNVAKIDGSRAYAGFKKAQDLQQRLMPLRREFEAARQAGDTARAEQISQQAQKSQEDVRSVMMDALRVVSRERHIDLVLGMRAVREGTPELDVLYRAPDVDVPDITEDVVTRINALAETRPALDSQPAPGAATTRPAVLRLDTRPAIRIQPPTPKK